MRASVWNEECTGLVSCRCEVNISSLDDIQGLVDKARQNTIVPTITTVTVDFEEDDLEPVSWNEGFGTDPQEATT